jgi:hypothetical protein
VSLAAQTARAISCVSDHQEETMTRLHTCLLTLSAWIATAACGPDSNTRPPPSAPEAGPRAQVAPDAGSPAGAPPAAGPPPAVDCGMIDEFNVPTYRGECAANRETVYKCFVDAFRAGRSAHFTHGITGTDSQIQYWYTIENGEIVVRSQDYVHSPTPGPVVIEKRCKSASIQVGPGGCKTLDCK